VEEPRQVALAKKGVYCNTPVNCRKVLFRILNIEKTNIKSIWAAYVFYIYICTDMYRYVRVLWMLTVHPWGSELRHPQSGRPQERERYHVEGLFLALRAVDNHVLVFAVRHSSSFGLMCGWIFAGSPQIVSEKSVAKKKGFMSFLVRGWLFDSSSGFVYWSSGFLIHILRKIISIICMGILYSVNIYIFTIYSQSIHNIFTSGGSFSGMFSSDQACSGRTFGRIQLPLDITGLEESSQKMLQISGYD
jgi:hypothetical protein